MNCPFCNTPDTKVIDSRPTEEGHAIRRRRECESCGKRFTTYEKVEEVLFMVVKRDGSREQFDRNKVLNGIIRACQKRPVSLEQMEAIVNDIEKSMNNLMEKEVSSEFIGNAVMDHLKNLDEVAYVRFASVYREFTDVGTFVSEIEKLISNEKSGKKIGSKK
ncbi:MAG: transcriptional repressor NrdR [Firmicutes bacterium]|nr:transcriptional repressor NrdR [Bacillota bacterium]MBR5926151.1 transcriptional repressor NrdR [Bacillota bacterium]